MPAVTASHVRTIADLAVTALHDEVDLTPKPGLVDGRGSGAHIDMTLALLHRSADALHTSFVECAEAAADFPVGLQLRARLGAIGRDGERAMLAETGGVNTHRGALWALGLLSAAVGAGATTIAQAVGFAARLARIPDPAHDDAELSHGARVARRYGVAGARGEAQAAFPHVTRYGLTALRAHAPPESPHARLDALVALIAHLDDTCLLHRGGIEGLRAVQTAARAVLHAGGIRTTKGRSRFHDLDRLCTTRWLSPGGAGDLLAVTMFLARLER